MTETVNLRDVPMHLDGGDIDDTGHWYGEDMCCLTCRETTAMRLGTTNIYLLAALECDDCGEIFTEYWI